MISSLNQVGLAAVERAEAEALFDELRRLTSDGVGVSRQSYGPGESAGLALIARRATELGLGVSSDAAANLVVTLPGTAAGASPVLVGSHMDSVPHGGNFDGAAGIIAGLLCLARFRRTGTVPRRTLQLIGLRGEESAWFGVCYLGSRALFGELTAEDLEAPHIESGKQLREFMGQAGADMARIEARQPLLSPRDAAAYYELHIEQGPVMVARDLPVGIVTGLRGNVRRPQVHCIGESAHSGATPRWLRRDAVLATCDLLHRMDEHWQILLERGYDLVMTSGIFCTNPADHAVSKVPDRVTFSFEARSEDLETLEEFDALFAETAAGIATERRVSFDLARPRYTAPARMDPELVANLERICTGLGLPAERLPSGAGHDAAEFARAGVPSAMIFVRNRHGSHNPAEAMDLDDFMLGTEVLFQALADHA